MEMCDEEQTVALVELIDDGEASMHALAGTYNPRTLRIQGIINGKEPNIVLGCQWLEKLGPITTDQRKLMMEFEGPRGRIRLKGDPHLVETALSGNSLKRIAVKGRVAYYCQLQCESKGHHDITTVSQVVSKILSDHDSLFAEPTEVPPERQLNHRIILNPNTAPINVHPYRYPSSKRMK